LLVALSPPPPSTSSPLLGPQPIRQVSAKHSTKNLWNIFLVMFFLCERLFLLATQRWQKQPAKLAPKAER
jgi:hypothetical protein